MPKSMQVYHQGARKTKVLRFCFFLYLRNQTINCVFCQCLKLNLVNWVQQNIYHNHIKKYNIQLVVLQLFL